MRVVLDGFNRGGYQNNAVRGAYNNPQAVMGPRFGGNMNPS